MSTNTMASPATESAPQVAPAPKKQPPAAVLLAGLTVGLAIILTLLLMVFIMPSLKSGPHNLPVGVVGTPAAMEKVTEEISSRQPDAFTFTEYISADDLANAIREREVSGGFVMGDGTVHTYVASAGSVAISSTIDAIGTALAASLGAELQHTDVVPLPAEDPSGIGIGGLAFPLVFGGIVPAVAFRAVFSRRLAWAIGGIIGFSLVGGVVVAAVLAFMFASITASAFWPVAGAMALGIAALALPLAGLKELFGGKGFTIGAMVMMFLGNPLAGISTSAAWLPGWLGTFGQALPPGSAGTLVRAVAYFDGAGGLGAALILAVWTLAGALMLAIAAGRSSKAVAAS
jgi:hypothetical protein